MGSALVVFTVSEEVLAFGAVQVSDGQGPRRELTTEEKALPLPQLLQRHPEASVRLDVPLDSVWQLPSEPELLDGRRAIPARVRQHTAAVARSLEAFLNQRLRGLHGMVRTGWWVLGRVGVKVTDMEPVPE